METIAIIALAACGVLWVASVVEFSRTMSELTRCRSLACRVMKTVSVGQ